MFGVVENHKLVLTAPSRESNLSIRHTFLCTIDGAECNLNHLWLPAMQWVSEQPLELVNNTHIFYHI